VQRCAEELDEDEGAEVVQPPPQRPPRFLFEGQFSPSAPAAAPPPAAAGLPPGAAALAALLGVEDDGDVLVGLERALAASLADAPLQHAGPPPAGRDAVRALRVEPLTRARLDALGGGVQCAVCREELREGDDVQRMPCSDAHCFHPPCLAPWLAQHNSCPVCRHELPTDDWRYEDRKRDAAQRAEDERGAANALRGGEFMWL
jgi:E3 ubiquitin-protein ligase AIP2